MNVGHAHTRRDPGTHDAEPGAEPGAEPESDPAPKSGVDSGTDGGTDGGTCAGPATAAEAPTPGAAEGESEGNGGVRTFRTRDLDEARAAILSALSSPTALTLHGRPEDFDFRIRAANLGSVACAASWSGARVSGHSGGLGAYHLTVQRIGRVCQHFRGQELWSTPADKRSLMLEPTGPAMLLLDAASEVLALTFDPKTLEQTLSDHLERPVRPLRFATPVDHRQGHGRTLAALADIVAAELEAPSGLLGRPAVAARLADTLLTTVLYATPHQYREALDAPVPALSPRPVKRAMDAMQADPARQFTLSELARIAEVGPRALQMGFKRHTGSSPMTYLRELRLERVHRELTRAECPHSVTEVATRWGFTHHGRFAAAYRSRYGDLPSRVLRRPGE